MHPPGRPQLAHAGIDNGNAGLAALPGIQPGRIAAPGEVIELAVEIFVPQAAEMMGEINGKVAPTQLGQEFLGALETAAALGVVSDRMPDRARRDFAPGQMR